VSTKSAVATWTFAMMIATSICISMLSVLHAAGWAAAAALLPILVTLAGITAVRRYAASSGATALSRGGGCLMGAGSLAWPFGRLNGGGQFDARFQQAPRQGEEARRYAS
jgi:hypothetical protein